MDMQERRKKLLNLNKIRGFDESHPISVSGHARYNNRLKSGVGKTPFQPATQSVYCISENETPNKDIICVLSNFFLRSCMSISFTCTVVLLTYIPAFCMALHEGTGMPAESYST
jgi:hypothetical protein